MLRVSISTLSGWLPGFAILFFGSLAAWKLSRQRLTSYARRLKLSLFRSTKNRETQETRETRETEAARETMRHFRELTKPQSQSQPHPQSHPDDQRKGFSRIWAALLLAVLVGSWALWAATAVIDHKRITAQQKEIETLKAQLADYNTSTVTEHNVKVITYLGKNEGYDEWAMASDEQGPFIFRGCNDFPNGKVIRVGYEAPRARWEERAECKSIRRDGLGFFWRDENLNYRRISQ